ncbi:unannotated protein [freshwater metagenome]|uniref:Unannotated protein n=1 Tax=freshwater metagenome TaxID=449393 RepID=A0A6J7QF32_9ZZZZ
MRPDSSAGASVIALTEALSAPRPGRGEDGENVGSSGSGAPAGFGELGALAALGRGADALAG